MAKNNGKFILFLMLFMMAVALTMIIGMSKSNVSSRATIVDSFSNNELVGSDKIAINSQNNLENEVIAIEREIEGRSQYVKLTLQKNDKIELLCLMYHNVVADNQKQGDYEVRVSALENDFCELKKLGYKCVSRQKLEKIIKNKKYGKYVMITFDDGFYGVYKYVPPLLEKYDMNCVVSVVGEYMDIADKQNYKTRCSYMNSKEVAQLAKNSRVEIAGHSYIFHHIINGRRGVKIKSGENKETYKLNFKNDTIKLQNKMEGFGVHLYSFCYPFGEFCKESESVLKSLGYQMTFTCTEKINYLTDTNSLYLIGRINRSAKYKNIQNLIDVACNKY